jgi:hypothetical protein
MKVIKVINYMNFCDQDYLYFVILLEIYYYNNYYYFL